DHTMQRPDEPAGLPVLPILSGRNFQRIRHFGIVVGTVCHAPCLSSVETPRDTRGWPKVQCRQRVDLSGVWFRRYGAKDTLRLIHAGSVVSLDSLQIKFDKSRSRNLAAHDRLLDLINRRLLQMKLLRSLLGRSGYRVRSRETQQKHSRA